VWRRYLSSGDSQLREVADAVEPDAIVDAHRVALGIGEQVRPFRPRRHRFRDEPSSKGLRVAAASCGRERRDVVDERRSLEDQERGQRDTAFAVDHREPSTPGRDQHLAFHRLQLIERVVLGHVEQSRRFPMDDPEPLVELRDLLDVLGRRDPGAGGHHHQVPRDPVAAGAGGGDEVRLVLRVEDHDVRSGAAALAHGGEERVLDLGQADRVVGLDARVVRFLDPREPGIGDDGAPPRGLDPLEQGVLRTPEGQERLEIGHGLIFAAAALRSDRRPTRPFLATRRRCDRLAPP